MSVGSRIKKRRIELGLSVDDLARLLGKNRATVYRYESSEIEKMPHDIIKPLAKALNVSPAYLMGWEDLQPIEVYPIPILNSISAGEPIEAVENIIGQTAVPATMNNKSNLFALKVRGDSMDKEFKENDIVIVEKDAPIKDNDIAIVIVNGYDATVKRIRFRDDEIVLIPNSHNDMHLPQVYKLDDDIILVGKVVSAQTFYN